MNLPAGRFVFMDPQPNHFRLVIEDASAADFCHGDELVLEAVACLRHLSGRRSVWQASHQGKAILLKLFDPHPKQGRDLSREWNNASRLYDAGMEIPQPLFTAKLQGGVLAVAFDFIDDGRPLNEVLDDFDASARDEVLRQLIGIHVKQHSLGCFQGDDHLGNYLWSRGQLYMLDAGSCVIKPAALGMNDRVSNMALLAANIPIPYRSAYDQAVAEYLDHITGEIDVAAFSAEYEKQLPKAIHKRLDDYRRKTKRSSSQLERLKSPGKRCYACRDMDVTLKEKLLDDPDQFFTKSNLIKDGNTCTVVGFEEGGRDYVIKRYNRKSFFYRLLHVAMPVRALTSWTGGHVLCLFGIATPQPVACLIIKSGPFVSQAYLLMEKTSGVLLDEIKKPVLLDEEAGVVQKFVRTWAQLEVLHATHGDMKASNFILDDSGVLQLIDLDSLIFHRTKQQYERQKAKDLARFLRNWEDCPELLERLRSELAAISG